MSRRPSRTWGKGFRVSGKYFQEAWGISRRVRKHFPVSRRNFRVSGKTFQVSGESLRVCWRTSPACGESFRVNGGISQDSRRNLRDVREIPQVRRRNIQDSRGRLREAGESLRIRRKYFRMGRGGLQLPPEKAPGASGGTRLACGRRSGKRVSARRSFPPRSCRRG